MNRENDGMSYLICYVEQKYQYLTIKKTRVQLHIVVYSTELIFNIPADQINGAALVLEWAEEKIFLKTLAYNICTNNWAQEDCWAEKTWGLCIVIKKAWLNINDCFQFFEV